MLSRFFVYVLNISPRFKKAMWKRVYEFLASRYPTEEWTFMNYGFASLNGGEPELETDKDENNRYFIQLYHHVVIP